MQLLMPLAEISLPKENLHCDIQSQSPTTNMTRMDKAFMKYQCGRTYRSVVSISIETI